VGTLKSKKPPAFAEGFCCRLVEAPGIETGRDEFDFPASVAYRGDTLFGITPAAERR
jgi:hypothetical protein